MRLLFSSLLFFASASAVASDLPSFDELSVGVGMGAQYSGLGINFSATTATDSKYASLGCLGYSETAKKAVCGVGVGWINTDWIAQRSNKHGLGVHFGIMGRENSVNDDLSRDVDPLYGVGFGYSYFSNGINKPGATYGISVHTPLKNEYLGDESIFFQIGYQF